MVIMIMMIIIITSTWEIILLSITCAAKFRFYGHFIHMDCFYFEANLPQTVAALLFIGMNFPQCSFIDTTFI